MYFIMSEVILCRRRTFLWKSNDSALSELHSRYEYSFLSSFLQDLYGDCDKLRQSVFQIATETEDHDNSLGKKALNLLLNLVTSIFSLFLIQYSHVERAGVNSRHPVRPDFPSACTNLGDFGGRVCF